MTDDVHRLTLELRLEAGAITGDAIDEHGMTHSFDGWLGLIAAVQAAQARGQRPSDDRPGP